MVKVATATEAPKTSVEELVGFLSHPRPELRKSASSLLINMTASDQGMHQLMQLQSFDVVQALCRLVSDMRPIAEDAIKALINLTAANPAVCERTLKFDLLNRVMTQVDDDEWRLKDYSMMLLANVSTTPEGARALMGLDAKMDDALLALRERKMRTLTTRFLETEAEPEGVDAATGDAKWDDEYQYVANIIANISQLAEGRDFLLKNRGSTTLLAELLPQLRSPNVVRRRGAAAAVRNICFDTDNHFFLYDQLDIPSKMNYLLAGPEALDDDDKLGMHPSVHSLGDKKVREQDTQVRLTAVECLLLLCTTRNGRADLRRKKVYPIVRNAHLVEPDEAVGDQIYKLVDFLIRDEEGEEPDWNEIRAKSLAPDEDNGESKTAEQVDDDETRADEATTAPTNDDDVDSQRTRSRRELPVPSIAKADSVLGKPLPEATVRVPTGDEDVDDVVAAALANEMNLLDVSSDEEDDNDEEEDVDVD